MSAFLVAPEHIAAIVGSAVCYARRQHASDRFRDPVAVATLLAAENARSVNYRYHRHAPQAAMVVTETMIRAYEMRPLPPVELLKALAGYEYQACECPDWREREACHTVTWITDLAVRSLPGYDEAAWSITSLPAPSKAARLPRLKAVR